MGKHFYLDTNKLHTIWMKKTNTQIKCLSLLRTRWQWAQKIGRREACPSTTKPYNEDERILSAVFQSSGQKPPNCGLSMCAIERDI